MTRNGKGSVEDWGKNVAQKRRLKSEILERS